MTLRVNGRVVYSRDGIEHWLEKDRRTWTAPDFRPQAPAGPALPVWLELREDDLVYGDDDQGDINPLDRRTALAFAYTPGTRVDRVTTGGSLYGGRLGDGGKASVRYGLRTVEFRPTSPPPAISP